MDSEVILSKESPKNTANILSKIFFAWLVGIIKKGNRNELASLCDLYLVDHCDKSSVLGDRLEYLWKAELEGAKKYGRKPKLIKALFRMFWKKYFLYGFYMFLHMGFLRVFQPIVIAILIQLFNDHAGDKFNLIIYSSALILLSTLIAFINNHSNLQLAKIGMQVRIACGSLIYRKTLKLNETVLSSHVSGQIANIISNDMNRFDNVVATLHAVWIVPLKLVFISYFMWAEMGISFLAGLLGMIFMTVVLQGSSGKLSSYFRKKTVARTEKRLNILNEFLLGIQTIKMSAWEEPFQKLLKNSRERELKFLTFTSYMTAVYETFCLVVEKAASYFTLICYYLLGYSVTADKVFFLSQCHNVLQMSMAVYFPYAIQNGAECTVSLRKLEEVLTLNEDVKTPTEGKDVVLETISTHSNGFMLEDVSFKIKQGELCALIGPVGCGKSTLLNVLLKELTPSKGTFEISENISYSSQKPWLFNSSIRKNVVFNQKYDRSRYQQVLKVTALSKDIESQRNADHTFVGEKGMCLSGGQRFRINLARAVYKDSDIYLLDDPFSALDAEVAKNVFERCVCKFLRGKTRVVVTHNLEILKTFDRIIVMNAGRIEIQGTYDDIIRSGNEYVTSSLKLSQRKLSFPEPDVILRHRKPSLMSRMSSMSLWSAMSENEDFSCEKITKETTLRQGFLPYKEYLKATGGLYPLLELMVLMVLAQISSSYCDYFLTIWTNSEFSTFSGDYYYFYVYTGALFVCILVTTVRSFAFFKLCLRASKNLHHATIDSLSKTSIKFFDETPTGRILNRFSKDFATIDCTLPRCAIEAIQVFLLTIGIVIMISISNYYLLIAVLVVGVLFAKLPSWYLSTSKKIKHLEGIAKSPVLVHLGTTVDGITTIRAFRSENEVKAQFDSHQDIHTSASYLSSACTVAFNLWLDLLAVIFLSLTVFGFIVLTEFADVSGSYVGLAITQAMVLTRILQYGVKQATECVNQVTSVERITEYKHLPEEEEIGSNKIIENQSDHWLQRGKLEFTNLYLKYSEYEVDILKKLNFVIHPGEKVGIVGRSGAGKSSVISAIFRMAILEGSIKIDDIDTREIPLSILRDKISIIPQEPVLFSMTIRYNLDPYGRYSDVEIWNALNEVDLKSSIPTLDYEIKNAGFNMSIGERQQICLARAILRNNKILILDEATANMDARTDKLIQKAIRKHFKNCTVMTIAHRLETVIDSDKIMFFSYGTLIEMDHPYKLLQDRNSYFYRLVSERGPNVLREFIDISSKLLHKVLL